MMRLNGSKRSCLTQLTPSGGNSFAMFDDSVQL